jgi:cellulose biosynthesis protein BcsQ
MLSSEQRLYTWIDVEDVLLKLKQENDWPAWLRTVSAYWDGLTFEIDTAIEMARVYEQMELWFEPRFLKSESLPKIGNIVLEWVSSERHLPVFIERTEVDQLARPFIPSWGRPTVLSSIDNFKAPPSLDDSSIPVVGFHSFKGGVGRTLTSISLAKQIAELGNKVLLVDADFEAPGISWLIQKRIPNPPFALSDFLSLLHSEPDLNDVISLSANRIKNMLVDGIFVVPAFRTMDQFAVLEVRPEHILQGTQNPYILTDSLSKLASALGASVAIIDLRAGLSELSAGLMLDPRVFRVCVSTIGGQSLEGTRQILGAVARLAPSTRSYDPVPAVVLSQLPRQEPFELAIDSHAQDISAWLSNCTNSETESYPIFKTYFDSTLRVLPADWSGVVDLLVKADSGDAVSGLIDWIGIESKQAANLGENFDFTAKRQHFSEWSKKLIYAERSSVPELLLTKPLEALISDNHTRVPIAVVVGAKGAGKTYTYLQLNNRNNWAKFASDVGRTQIDVEAYISPALQPKNLDEQVAHQLATKRKSIANALGFNEPGTALELQDMIIDALGRKLNQVEWRKVWLQLIAFSLGFNRYSEPNKLIEDLVKQNKKAIVTFDGLEDIFQSLANDDEQKVGLRALLQDIPDWLSQQPERPLGIVIFIREDMVLESITQNARQFMHRYESYALRWSHSEALRLVVWMCAQSDVMFQEESIYSLDEIELRELLAGFWGRKLGSDNSREARAADWVLGALSGPKKVIQARDLVRLTSYAAEKSINETRWQDRLLTPNAMRNSLAGCSKEKVAEIMQENAPLAAVLTKLQSLNESQRKTPFKPSQLEEITLDDLKLLELNGIIVKEGGCL